MDAHHCHNPSCLHIHLGSSNTLLNLEDDDSSSTSLCGLKLGGSSVVLVDERSHLSSAQMSLRHGL